LDKCANRLKKAKYTFVVAIASVSGFFHVQANVGGWMNAGYCNVL